MEGKSMRDMILFFSLVLIVSCTACKPSPQPTPQATTAKLTLTMIGNTGAGFGKGIVTFAPTPQSGNAKCNLVGTDPLTCTATFAQAAEVTLSVLPNANDGSRLEKITGCNVTKCEGCAPGETTCQLTMNGDKSVTAVFIGALP
jgi:hypothetical protein